MMKNEIELEADLKCLEAELCQAISVASRIRSPVVEMSEKERRAWRNFKRTMGKNMPMYLEYPSTLEIAKKGCECVRKFMLKRMK